MRVGHRSALDQLDEGVAEHLCMDPEVLMSAQPLQHRFRNAAHADLDCGAIGNQLGDVAGNGAVHLGHLALVELGQRLIGFNEGVHLAGVHGRVTERARHVPVHLHNQPRRLSSRRQRDFDARSQAHPAVAVRRRRLDQSDVNREFAVVKQPLDFVQEHGDIIRPALLHRLACVGGDEQCVVSKNTLVLRFCIGGGTERDTVQHLDISQPA